MNDQLFSTMPAKSIEVTFTISGLTSDLSAAACDKSTTGQAYLGGGFSLDGAAFNTTFWQDGSDPNPAETQFTLAKVTGNGQYTVGLTFPDQGGDDTSSGTDSMTQQQTASLTARLIQRLTAQPQQLLQRLVQQAQQMLHLQAQLLTKQQLQAQQQVSLLQVSLSQVQLS